MSEKNGLSFAVLFLPGALVSISLCIPAYASGTTYYINNSAGSNCNDDGAHSITAPWCSFMPLNEIRSFLPGDQILLASGSTWDQEMTLTGSGTPTEPILLSSYGTGERPRILRKQATSDICVLLTNPSYWNISNLEVGAASVGILLHYTQLFNNGITISNIYAHDNKGIWSGYSTEIRVSHNRPDPFAASLNINLSSHGQLLGRDRPTGGIIPRRGVPRQTAVGYSQRPGGTDRATGSIISRRGVSRQRAVRHGERARGP